jgi:DNA mismatch repair protein MutS
MALLERYFNHTQKYKSIYGEKTVVLIEVGSFYEIYGRISVDVNNNEIITCSNIEDVANVCGIKISKKTSNVVMAGFTSKIDYILAKYIQKLQEASYTVVVYKQNEENVKDERKLSGIYSPGTTFIEDNNVITNNIMCIRLLNIPANALIHKNKIIFGMSNIDVLSGNCNLTEYQETYYHEPSTYDELEKYYSIHNPNELIILYNSKLISLSVIKDILHFIGSVSNLVRYVDLDEQEDKTFTRNDNNYSSLLSLSKRARNCDKLTYKLYLIDQFYNNITNSTKEVEDMINTFELYDSSTHSFCFLLDYIYSHNPNLVNNIKIPEIYNQEGKLLLANHSLKQLNFLDSNISDNIYGISNKLKSVVGFLNNCKTAMGKRMIHNRLLKPITNIDKLNTLYNNTEYIINNYLDYGFEKVHYKMRSLKDLEKVYRKIVLEKIVPDEIYDLFNNIMLVKEIYESLNKQNKYFQDNSLEREMFENIYDSLSIIYNHFKLSLKCDLEDNKSLNSFDTNFFLRGIFKELDDKYCVKLESQDIINSLMLYLEKLIKNQENKSTNKPYFTLNIPENDMPYIKVTDLRYKKLITEIDTIQNKKIKITYKSSYDNSEKYFYINLKNISKQKRNKDTTIISEEIMNYLNNFYKNNKIFNEELKNQYNNFINELKTLKEHFINIIDYIVFLDVNITIASNALKYNYCRPCIISDAESSFVNAYGLRHLLIEQLQTQESFVPNDLCLGNNSDKNNQNGILLYGTNAVGKSSLIKAIGISVILAQCGMYVPCNKFNYKPFTSIFTRILGNDNIFKGLSTFQVEMSELRTILKLADNNSLVLGDELCSGTEIGSALSIFSAGVIQLHNKDAKFIFATHFHEMNDIDEITNLENMKMKHMSVHYDVEKDKLIYDRLLKDGPGNNQYGLEVCKSLHLPRDFLDLAYGLRTKILKNEESISMYKQSKYNSKKLLGKCEICGKKADEIHHIKQQKDANEFGIVDGIHKNHLSNLMSLCEKCHDKIHS